MGVDTKGVVLTPCKDVMLVCTVVEYAISRLVRQGQDELFPGVSRFADIVRQEFAAPTIEIRPSFELVDVAFKFFGEQRSLKLFFECDCDHEDLAPLSLSMVLGCWGQSVLLMRHVLHALSFLGAVYIDENDGDSVSEMPLEADPLNVMGAVAWRYLPPHAVKRVHQLFKKGEFGTDLDYAQFMGVDEQTLAATDWAYDAILALANERHLHHVERTPLLPQVRDDTVVTL